MVIIHWLYDLFTKNLHGLKEVLMAESDCPAVEPLAGPPGQLLTAAVAFADIVGYSILMSTEGEQTYARWMTLLDGTLRPLARAHGSTLLKSTGDGVVAQFR